MRRLAPAGVWEAFIPGVEEGALYNYLVTSAQGATVTKTDPVAFATTPPPGNASVVYASHHTFADSRWMRSRSTRRMTGSPMSIYEVHVGSWRRNPDGSVMSYRQLAAALPRYCTELGFTHVEFLPLAEHPFGGSWGYQISNYFAPSARYGDPDDFKFLVDALHGAQIGVIVDWVPAHFPKDPWALAHFDGTHLYEDADPDKGLHPDWGTMVFDYARPAVRNFLISSTLYWAEQFHVDGFRVDAVASMLYLDYSRKKGEWTPNRFGGRQNLEAVEFVQELTSELHDEHPDVLIIAEESGAWPGVTRPVSEGGLGFDFKWNLGWMHDTLEHFRRTPHERRRHLDDLTFTLMYAWSENYILPFSHDEVVHEKRSLLNKMTGDKPQRMAMLKCLLAYMWAYPGKQLLFMGNEIAQEREWNHDSSIDWDLLGDSEHTGIQHLVTDLNHIYRDTPALWDQDHVKEGFRWTTEPDARNNVISFFRTDAANDRHLVFVCNLAPVLRKGFRIGMPKGDAFEEVVNTNAETYGGCGEANPGTLETQAKPAQGSPYSTLLTLAPYTALWLRS
jgi:1,4-alpha-glucan branching enzyme